MHLTGVHIAELGADPLIWPLPLKIFVLTQVSLLSSLGEINVALINPT